MHPPPQDFKTDDVFGGDLHKRLFVGGFSLRRESAPPARGEAHVRRSGSVALRVVTRDHVP